MSRIVSFVVLLTIAILVGVLSFMVMSSFLLPMFLALVLAVIFRPLHKWFIARSAGHVRVAAGMTTAAILLIVLIPTLLILTRAAGEAFFLVREVQPQVVAERLAQLRRKFDLEMPPENVQTTLQLIGVDVEEIADGVHLQNKTPEELRELARRMSADLDQIHEQLALADPQAEDESFKAETRQHIAASWQMFHEQAERLDQAAADMPAFAATLPDVTTAYSTFRESLLGSPTVAWIRLRVNPDDDQIRSALSTFQQWLTPFLFGTSQAVGGFLGSAIVGLGVMILSLYYFLADGPSMIRALMHLSPLDDRYEEELLNEFSTISRAVVLATLLSAFAQGLLASIGYFFAGFESVFLLTVVTMLLAMIPFVGAAAVWGACSVWLFFYEQRTMAALGLALYGALVVSMIDNVIKPMVLHGQSKLHPLLALLSILGGMKVLGPIGIFVGPMGMAFLQALLHMLHNELVAMGEPAQAEVARPAPPAA